jgi:hypothetical protein
MSSKHSTRTKRAVRPSRQLRVIKRPPAPDLSGILAQFLDGLSLARAAHTALRAADLYGPAEVTLRVSLESLQGTYDALQTADLSLHASRGGRS